MASQKPRAVVTIQEMANSAHQRASDFHVTLLVMAGHDLRQPLQIILNSLSKLARCNMQGPALDYIRRGEIAVGRLVEHLDHLIEALRLHERAPAIALKPVQIGPLLAAACQDHADLVEQKDLRLRCCATDVAVMSDTTLLKGVVGNLVRNALKYTPAGGKVLVGCRRQGPVARIEIHDTGVGIPKDQLSKVFEAFHRVSSTRPDGLGLGLFIVRRTVDLLGHRIDVRSTEGCGTCFSILAQVAPSTPAPDILQHQCDNTAIDLHDFSVPDQPPMHRALVALGI